MDRQLFYNLLTRDALLIYSGVAHPLEGPYDTREDAERAAEELISRLDEDDQPSERRQGREIPGKALLGSRVKALFDIQSGAR